MYNVIIILEQQMDTLYYVCMYVCMYVCVNEWMYIWELAKNSDVGTCQLLIFKMFESMYVCMLEGYLWRGELLHHLVGDVHFVLQAHFHRGMEPGTVYSVSGMTVNR